jgi:hypothetical protein
MTVSFYADRTLERSGTGRLATDDRVSYAVLPTGAVDRIDRPHTVLARGPENGITVVEFETG